MRNRLVLLGLLVAISCATAERVNTLDRQPLLTLNAAPEADDHPSARFLVASAQLNADADQSLRSTGDRQMNVEALFTAAGAAVGGAGNCKKTTYMTCGTDSECVSDPSNPCSGPCKCEKGGMVNRCKCQAEDKSKGLECCQICPQKFYMNLELMELEESVMRRTYSHFHVWHSTVHAASKPTEERQSANMPWMRSQASWTSSGQSLSFLELQKDPIQASIDALGTGPCCELCPDMFYPRPPSPPGAKKSGEIQYAMLLETDASAASLGAARGSSASADTYWPRVENSAFMSRSCCKICPAQFFAPRSFADVMAPKSNAPAAKTGGGCCRTCPIRMMESSTLDTMDSDNGDMQPEEVASAAYAPQPKPPNPANHRTDYA